MFLVFPVCLVPIFPVLAVLPRRPVGGRPEHQPHPEMLATRTTDKAGQNMPCDPPAPGQGRGQRAGPRAAGAGVDGRRTHAGADGRRMHTAPAEQVAWRLAGGLIGVKGSQCVIVLAEATALRYQGVLGISGHRDPEAPALQGPGTYVAFCPCSRARFSGVNGFKVRRKKGGTPKRRGHGHSSPLILLISLGSINT